MSSELFLYHVTISQWSWIFPFLRNSRTMHQGNQTISAFFILGFTVGSEQQQLIFMMFLCMYLITMAGNLIIIIILAIINDTHLHSPMWRLLSCQSTLHWHLLHNHYSPQNVGRYPKQECNHLICRMPYTNVPFYASWPGQLPLSSHGMWLVHCHLLPITLCCITESQALCPSGSDSMGHLQPCLKTASQSSGPFDYLWSERNSTFLLWPGTHFKVCLLRHPHQWLDDPSPWGSSYSHPLYLHSYLICPYWLHCTWGSFSMKEGGNFLHLCLPSLSCIPLPWILCWSQLPPLFWLLSRKNKLAAITYTAITPMMNPFIYSLRNKDMKRVLRRLLSRKNFLWRWCTLP